MGVSALRGLVYPREHKSRRFSSYDREGRNADYLLIAPGATATLALIQGAGCISHIWTTIKSDEPHFCAALSCAPTGIKKPRRASKRPSETFRRRPRTRNTFNLCRSTWSQAAIRKSKLGGDELFFPMPFTDGARFTLTNEGEQFVRSFITT
jgi:hypothetical protein